MVRRQRRVALALTALAAGAVVLACGPRGVRLRPAIQELVPAEAGAVATRPNVPRPDYAYPPVFPLLATHQERSRRLLEVGLRMPHGHSNLELHGTGLVAKVVLTGAWASSSEEDPFAFTVDEVRRWHAFFDERADLFGLRAGAFALVPNVGRHGFVVEAGRGRSLTVSKEPRPGNAGTVSVMNFDAFGERYVPPARIPAARALQGLLGLQFKMHATYEHVGPVADRTPPPPTPPLVARTTRAEDFVVQEGLVWVCKSTREVEIRRVYDPRFVPRLEKSSRGVPPAEHWALHWHPQAMPTLPARPVIVDAITGDDISERTWSSLPATMKAESCAESPPAP